MSFDSEESSIVKKISHFKPFQLSGLIEAISLGLVKPIYEWGTRVLK